MKEGLDILLKLQQKDDQIKEIENTIKEIPQRIQQMEKERDKKAEMVGLARDKLQVNLEERRKVELEIFEIKERIKKYREQMKKVTTNKEYQGFISEIQFAENSVTCQEEKIIEKMVEADEIVAEISQVEKEYSEITASYNRKISELKSHQEFNSSKLQEEKEKRQVLQEQVEKDLLRVYNNLFQRKLGKVISTVDTEFCGVCNLKIRPQLLSELITTNDLLICENCGRLLFKKIGPDKEENSTET